MDKRILKVWELGTYFNSATSLAGFIEMLQGVYEREKAAGTLTFRTERERGYYGDSDDFSVWIKREETDAECANREKEEVARAEAQRIKYAEQAAEKEQQEYARLKAKFEGKT